LLASGAWHAEEAADTQPKTPPLYNHAPHQTDANKKCTNKNRLPLAVAPQTNASTDICQIGPFMCTPEGRLQKAMFGGAGLFCPGFPREFAAFGALRTLEVQTASFEGDTFDDVAKVCVLFQLFLLWFFRSARWARARGVDVFCMKEKARKALK
jgi:hypothetical protein